MFRVCPFRCPNPVYKAAPRIVKRAIYELKIYCKGCKKEFKVEEIDAHELICDKPKCACYDCDTLESNMKQMITVLLFSQTG